MSSGYTILAATVTPDGHVSVRECWGYYGPDEHRQVRISDGTTELWISSETLDEMVKQVQMTRQALTDV